ncbi:MAG TPA: VOC family protein [Gemmatimonadales bacterium]
MPARRLPHGHALSFGGRPAQTIDFLEQAFGAEATELTTRPDGTPWHGEVRIGDSMVMLSQAQGEWKPNQSSLYLYVPDADTTYRRALAAGATSVMEPTDTFYRNRECGVKHGGGNYWWIATRVAEVSREEVERRARSDVKH